MEIQMQTKHEEPRFTRLTSDHLPQALLLSQQMGWLYRLEDWQFAHALGEGFALELGERLIGTAMGWHYGDAFASVGMIIVDNDFQGHGYGARLVDLLIEAAGSSSILRNSTREGFALYQRRKFVQIGETHQHQAVPLPPSEEPLDPRVQEANPADLTFITCLDEEGVGMPRNALIGSLAQHGRLTVIREGDGIKGYAASRPFGKGHVIGPVVAENLDDACALVEHAIRQLPDSFVRVDTASDSGLSAWLSARGLEHVATEALMVRGMAPLIPGPYKKFALCSQSLC
jgi:GNAT superfamily N-acetyltransferase